jgi:diacylglycerol kinase (ATP)
VNQRIAIFANPNAGKGKAKTLAARLHARFLAQGWQANVVFDRADQVDGELVRSISAAVSIGGDGTLRGVVERITDGGANPGPGVLVVPMGTANLMGKHLGVELRDHDIEDRAVEAIEGRRMVHLDAGRIKGSGFGVQGSGRMFLLMVGVGIDGEIVHALDKVRSGPIGFTSYLKPAFSTLAGYAYPSIAVEVDGRRVFAMSPAVAFVGNIAEYGTGFAILPRARSDDEVLDVCVLPATSPGQLIKHFLAAAAGEHLMGEGVVYTKGRRVRVTSDKSIAVQADGDPAGHTPTDIELLKTRVAFIVPP